MLPKIRKLAKKQGVTVECKPSTEKVKHIHYGWQFQFTDKYKDKFTQLMYPGQSEMICHDAFGEELSRETSFNLPIFEAWILSDRCNPTKFTKSCHDDWFLEESGRYLNMISNFLIGFNANFN